jgi:glucan biosynthesis protein C
MVQDHVRVAAGEAPVVELARAKATPRLAYIDNLRWSMILLVISMHAADTYSPFGNWYFADKAATDRLTALALGTWQSFLQAFFMALLFAVSGYFARASLLKKGAARFVRERVIRLGAPTLLYMLVIGPVTQFYVAGSWRPAPGTPFLAEWWRHIVDGEVWSESGPLWFCVALLAFSLVYAALPRRPVAAPPAHAGSRLAMPAIAVFFTAVMALATFAARLLTPEGQAVLNLQLGDFPQYVLMFAAGVLAHRAGWAGTTPPGDGSAWLLAGVVGGLLAWALLIATGGALAGHFETYGGGWHWQAAAKSLWESFVCVSVSLGLIGLYRRRLNHSGPLFAFLSANAFAVYVFHPPILIAVTRVLALWGGGPALAKFALAWSLAALLSFLFAAFIARRIPGVRTIL